MLATKSCASIELRMGRGGVCLGLPVISSVMASAPDLSACHPSKPIWRATNSCASASLKFESSICSSLRWRNRGSAALIWAATG